MSHPVLPEHRSALAFDSVWIREAVFVDNDEDYSGPVAGAAHELNVRLELKITAPTGAQRAFVRVRAVIEPARDRKLFRQLSVAVEGTFRLSDGTERERLMQFARVQAPVLLLPYLRSVVSTITAQARMGAIVLPPINMVPVIEQLQAQSEAEPATRGRPA